MAIQTRSDGTYLHEVKATLQRAYPGYFIEHDGTKVLLQNEWELEENMEYIRFLDGDMDFVNSGWTADIAIYDEVWCCLARIEY